MNARIYIPSSLAPLVRLIWEQRSDEPMGWKILPSGRVELIFNLGPSMLDLVGRRVGNAFNPTEHFCFLSGLHTRPLVMRFPRFHVMGVQMEPLAVKALFGIPCIEVRDWAVHGGEILAELNAIEDRLRGPGDFPEKAVWLEQYLHRLLRRAGTMEPALLFRGAVDRMTARTLDGSRHHAEGEIGYSRMHMHRMFNEWLGLPPGEFFRLERFVRTVAAVHAGEESFTTLAHRYGYHDQAHFNHHFQRFAGMSPTQYRSHRWQLPGQLPV